MFSDTFVLLVISTLFINPWNTLKEVASQESSIQNIHFTSTLTNQLTQETHFLEEWIQIENNYVYPIASKIEVTKEGFEKVTIFNHQGSDYQLVMYDNFCIDYGRGARGSILPDLSSSPLELQVLMSGASYYFMRFNKGLDAWTQGDTEQVRGRSMKSQWQRISSKLNCTVYTDDVDWIITRPLRIHLSGYPEYTLNFDEPPESITLDFYTIEYSTQDFSTVIVPTPGIGCYHYFQNSESKPETDFGKKHYYIEEDLGDNKPPSRSEVFVDKDGEAVRTVPRGTGNVLATLADYRLGTKFILFKNGKCQMEAIQGNEKGLSRFSFDPYELLWDSGYFLYVGRMFYDHRSGILCHVWESMAFKGEIDGEKYDKVVITHYFTENAVQDDPSNDMQYIPVGSTRIGYKQGANRASYVQVKFQRRDIYEFEPTIEDSEYHSLFQISDCYPDPEEKLSLTFDIRLKDSDAFNESLRLLENNIFTFRESLEPFIPVSKFRIANIDFDFSPDRILAKVLLLEKPPIEALFTVESKQVDISSMEAIYPGSLDECLQYIALKTDSYARNVGFLWCDAPGEKKACLNVGERDDLVSNEEKVTSCQLYRHPVGSMWDVSREIPLASVHDQILSSVVSSKQYISAWIFNRETGSTSQIVYYVENVMYEDMPEDVKTTKQLFTQVLPRLKLSQVRTNVQKAAGSIKTLADCFRACKSSDQMKCSAFSFCSAGPNDKECLLTDEVFDIDRIDPEGYLQNDLNCDIYEKQHLLDYQKIGGREFISVGTNRHILAESPENCAKRCADSKNCDSFQFCEGKVCTLLDTSYMPSKTQPTSNCSIYAPKKLENFKITGNSLVKEIIHTEVDINLEQCATLCYQNNVGGDKCQSFNYCPKGTSKSSCQLAKVKLSTSKQGSLNSGDCKNYELIETKSSQNKAPNGAENISKTSVGSVFGTIMVFGLVGLIFGAAASFGWSKYSRNSNASSLLPSSIPWSRQKDEEDQVQINSTL